MLLADVFHLERKNASEIRANLIYFLISRFTNKKLLPKPQIQKLVMSLAMSFHLFLNLGVKYNISSWHLHVNWKDKMKGGRYGLGKTDFFGLSGLERPGKTQKTQHCTKIYCKICILMNLSEIQWEMKSASRWYSSIIWHGSRCNSGQYWKLCWNVECRPLSSWPHIIYLLHWS